MRKVNKVSREHDSYRNILKSSSLIGGASVLNILIGIFRTKFVAVLLGPTGVGLIGMYEQITVLITTLTGMGISSSGIRQVAEAVGTCDDKRISRTIITLRRMVWLSGGLGLLVMLALCIPLSTMTFGTKEYAWSIATLSFTPLIASIAGGQGCILIGTRRIKDLAKLSIISAINSTLINISCFYLWGQAGIVPSLILAGVASLVTTWWFARRIPVKAISLPWHESFCEARQLFLLGVSLMGAGLVTVLSSYLIRIAILRQFGVADVGVYQAAFNLSGVLVGFVLGAMGTEYYPRLTAAANDNVSVHRMINEQSQISILLALPGLVAVIIFAPLIVKCFYTASFDTAVPILRWCIIGMLGRVISWPMRYMIVAKGKGVIFLLTDVFSCIVHLAGVYFFTLAWGINGAGIAFMFMYFVNTVLMFFVMQKLVGATWIRHTFGLILLALTVILLVMFNCTFNSNFTTEWLANAVILVGITYFCVNQLLRQSDISVQELLIKFRLKK